MKRERSEGGWVRMGWETTAAERHERRRGKNERARALFRARASIHRGAAGPGPSRLNAVKLSSYSHKGNSLSQPVKYKRVFPAGRFSTPIVFWAGLLFSVALRRAAPRRATLPTIISTNNDDRSLLLVRIHSGEGEGGQRERTDQFYSSLSVAKRNGATLREGTPTIYDRTKDRSLAGLRNNFLFHTKNEERNVGPGNGVRDGRGGGG